jgi:eukaryotic-like serine/threonine-protein kinase
VRPHLPTWTTSGVQLPTAPERLTIALADRYRIERELGAGGMATVYLAADLRHDRRVALKVLRPDLAAVIGASRFLHEIKTTANLQHPHILALHDSGEVDGTVFYVMPYVDGESLRDRLIREKQLPVEEAIRIAVEVAGALEYAHQHKVIHRDIKPENILLQGGHALVADFGIALAAARSDSGSRMTETGMSLGTPHYMSPEQAMGEREITAKSDVYALGCVLYEMLTGEPPFTGPTAQAIVARVMTEEPRSLTLQRRTIPRHVEAAVNRALSKLPADRFGSAAQFAEALLNPAAMPPPDAASFTAGTPRARSSRAVAFTAGIALLLAGAAFLAGRATTPAAPARLVRFSMELPDSVTGVGRCCGVGLALSPDGNTLVFVGFRAGSGPLYRRSLGRLDAEPIPGTDGASVPFFSPDGRWVGFFLDGRIRKVSLAGGPPITIAAAASVGEASWSEGDRIVFADRGELKTVSASGGEPRSLTTVDSLTSIYAPSFLPGGQAVLVTTRPRGGSAEAARIGVVDLASGKLDTIGLGTKAIYASGYLVFTGADNTLLAQPFNPKSRKTTGEAVAFLDRITLHGGTTHEFTLSTSGGLAYQPAGAAIGGDALRLAGPTGKTAINLPGRRFDYLDDPAFSPDGGRIALASPAGTTSGNIVDLWLLDRRQGTLERFTVGGGWAPSWSRDGRRIAFSRTDGLYVKNSDGTGEARLILKGVSLTAGSWLPADKALVFQGVVGPTTRGDIGIITLGDSTPRWLVATEFRERHPQVSRDGRWLAYASDRTGRFELYVQPLEGGGPAIQVSTEGGVAPRWSQDDRTLYYMVGETIVAATRALGPGFVVASRRTVLDAVSLNLSGAYVNWDLHPNGKEFLYIDQAAGGGARMAWILNWPELVKSLATAK